MANILIAGCGYIGTRLGLQLTAAGHRVWGLRTQAEGLPEAITPWTANLNDPATLRPLPAAFDCVFYTVGARGGSEADYRAAYVDGATHLLDALKQQDPLPQRILFTSSTAVYEQDQGEWVDEATPVAPTRHTGRIMREAEQLFLDSPLTATIVRLGGIYGPGRTRLLDMVRQGRATCIPERPQYLNLIHRDDAVAALYHLMTLEQPESIYIGVDNEPVEKTELLCWLAEQLQVPPPPTIPAAEAPPLLRGGNRRCANKRLLQSGYAFNYPTYREGYTALI